MNKFVETKIKEFKKLNPINITEGNYIYSESSHPNTINWMNATKETIDIVNPNNSIGQLRHWDLKDHSINTKLTKRSRMNTITGEISIEDTHNIFYNLNINNPKHDTNELKKIMLIGEPYEYLKDYPHLWAYELPTQFNSFKEFKIFMGFSFLSNKDFNKTLDLFRSLNRSITSIYIFKNKKNLLPLLNKIDSNHDHIITFLDYITLCITNDQPILIQKSPSKIKKQHDEIINENNKIKLSHKSKTQTPYIKPSNPNEPHLFTQSWDNIIPITYKHLNSEYLMWEEGIKQKNCLGSLHADKIVYYSYFSIKYNNEIFDIQIDPTLGEIVELKGYNNCTPPETLVNILNDNINYEHIITDHKGNEFKSDYVTVNYGNGIVGRGAYEAQRPNLHNDLLMHSARQISERGRYYLDTAEYQLSSMNQLRIGNGQHDIDVVMDPGHSTSDVW